MVKWCEKENNERIMGGRKGGQAISEREMERDKRSKASELQRLQLVAEPTVETKSKKINIMIYNGCQANANAEAKLNRGQFPCLIVKGSFRQCMCTFERNSSVHA